MPLPIPQALLDPPLHSPPPVAPIGDIRVLLKAGLFELLAGLAAHEDALHEGGDLLDGEVVGVAGQLVQKVQVLARYEVYLGLQDAVD